VRCGSWHSAWFAFVAFHRHRRCHCYYHCCYHYSMKRLRRVPPWRWAATDAAVFVCVAAVVAAVAAVVGGTRVGTAAAAPVVGWSRMQTRARRGSAAEKTGRIRNQWRIATIAMIVPMKMMRRMQPRMRVWTTTGAMPARIPFRIRTSECLTDRNAAPNRAARPARRREFCAE
jgi:hypothetical protein